MEVPARLCLSGFSSSSSFSFFPNPSGPEEGEIQLTLENKTAYEIHDSPENPRVCRVFPLDFPIIHVISCFFPSSGLCWVFLHENALTVQENQGEIHFLPLPCRMERIFPLKTGIFLERHRESGDSEEFSLEIPLFFTLTDPLEEIRPVAIENIENSLQTSPMAGVSEENPLPLPRPSLEVSHQREFFMDFYEFIVFVGSEILVTFHQFEKVHTIWAIERISEDSAGFPQDFVSSEFSLRRLYREEFQNAQGISGFLQEFHQHALFFLLTPQPPGESGEEENPSANLLTAYLIQNSPTAEAFITPLWNFPCFSAIPVNNDLIVLDADRKIALFHGNQRICDISLEFPIASEAPGEGEKQGEIPFPVSLENNIGNHFSLLYSNGRHYRLSLNNEFSDRLIFSLFSIVSHCLEASMEFRGPLRGELIKRRKIIKQRENQTNSDNEEEEEGNSSEWTIWMKIFQEILKPKEIPYQKSGEMENQEKERNLEDIQMEIKEEENSVESNSLNTPGLRTSLKHSRSRPPSLSPSTPNPDSDWEFLLASDFHQENSHLGPELTNSLEILHEPKSPQIATLHRVSLMKKPKFPTNDEEKQEIPYKLPDALYSPGFSSYFPLLLRHFHYLYEELSINPRENPDSPRKLADFLYFFARSLNFPYYCDYYHRDYPELERKYGICPLAGGNLERPESLMEYLQEVSSEFSDFHRPPRGVENPGRLYGNFSDFAPGLYETSRKLCLWYDLLAGFTGRRYEKTENVGKSLDFMCSTAAREIITANSPQKAAIPTRSPGKSSIPSEFLQSRGHSVLFSCFSEGFSTQEDFYFLPMAISYPFYELFSEMKNFPLLSWEKDIYSLLGRKDLMEMFFPTSPSSSSSLKKKGGENSSSPVVSSQYSHFPDLDGTLMVQFQNSLVFPQDLRLKEVRYLLRSDRIFCLSLEKEKIQQIEAGTAELTTEQQTRLYFISKRAIAQPVGRGMFTLGSLQNNLTQPLEIPPIRLTARIPPKNGLVDMDLSLLPSNFLDWPQFHNGVAAGLRISPQTEITRTWLIYNRPEKLNCSHAGFLFSMGLLGHLNVLEANDIYSYLSANEEATKIAVLLGLAAGKRGSSDSTISKMLCLHLPALLPVNVSDLELPMSVQTAALMGLGLLYQGSAHRLMVEVLLAEIGKRPTSDKFINRDGYALAAGLALGLLTLGRGENSIGLTDLQLENRLALYIHGGADPFNRPDQNAEAKCAKIHQGSQINTDITGPGATLALGMLYIQSNNRTIANRLTIPATHYEMDFVPPEFLFHRLIARSLILWDEISPEKSYIDQQIPEMIRQNILPLEYYHPYKGFTGNFQGFQGNPGENTEDSDSDEENTVDYEIVRQSYCYLLSGLCFSIGLKYSGTADDGAREILFYYLQGFRLMRKKKFQNASVNRKNRPIAMHFQTHRVDRPTLENCLAMIAIALALVMAGTGDLETFRLFRSLRLRPDKNLEYGDYMSLSMCFGLLFLGGGKYSLRNSSPDAIAALLIAFYPKFPGASDDQKFHLQAWRHFYVLAAEKRFLQAKDVETGEDCSVPLEILLKSSDGKSPQTLRLSAPCLLPDIQRIQQISIVNSPTASSSYFPYTLDISSNPFHRRILTEFHCLTVQSTPVALTRRFDARRWMDYLLENKEISPCSLREYCHFLIDSSTEGGRWIMEILYQTQLEGKMEIFPVFLYFFSLVQRLRQNAPISPQEIREIHFFRSLYGKIHRNPSFLQENLLEQLKSAGDQRFSQGNSTAAYRLYRENGRIHNMEMSSYLEWWKFPCFLQWRALEEEISHCQREFPGFSLVPVVALAFPWLKPTAVQEFLKIIEHERIQ